MAGIPEIELKDLDGDYEIVYQTNAPKIPGLEIWFDHTSAQAKISAGVLVGKDDGNCSWRARLTLLPSANVVEFAAEVDPSMAPENTFLLNELAQATREKQFYHGALKIVSLGKNLSLSGEVKHGLISIHLNMKKKNA